MGYRNVVHVIASESYADGESGTETPGSNPLNATARDEESIAEVGELVADTDRSIYLKTPEDCQKRANLLLNFFKLFKNALTKPKVTGIVPPLHSRVSYSVFVPIGEDAGATEVKLSGVVVARKIDYSIEGLDVELTVSPGAEDMETYVEDDTISEFVEHYGEDEV